MKNYLKGIATTILISLAAYAVISGVRLAERFVEAKEQEVKAIEYCERFDLGGPNRSILIDKKERKSYKWDDNEDRFVLIGR